MAATQETLQQSTDSDTTVSTDAAVQISSLHLHIMDLQDEILAKGIDLVFMKATYDKLYSIAGVAGGKASARSSSRCWKRPLHEVPKLHRVQRPDPLEAQS
jgi:hypothetical protein